MNRLLIAAALLMVAACDRAEEPAAPAPKAVALGPGATVYRKWCSHCHEPGMDHPGTLALTAKYGKERSGVLLERNDLTPDVVKAFVRTGVSMMPQFRKTEISDAELDALANFVASSGKSD